MLQCFMASLICRYSLPFKWFATRMQLSLCSVCGHWCCCTSVVAVDGLVAVFVSHCIYNVVILNKSPASLLYLLSLYPYVFMPC